MITQEILKELFDYNNGNFVRKKTIQSRSMQGQIAGARSTGNRYIVSVNYKRYKLHRLIWLWHHGNLPKEIDHIDGDPSNNKIENLRPASRCENMRNTKIPVTNKSGYKGVSWHRHSNKWIATITVENKQIYLGLFDCIEQAHQAYCKASKEKHGDFSRIF